MDEFINAYNKQFRKYSMDELYDDIMRMVFKGINGALVLYASNLNGQALIELAGILERYAIVYITELFKSFPDRLLMVKKLLEKSFLDELAKSLIVLGLLDQSDEQGIILSHFYYLFYNSLSLSILSLKKDNQVPECLLY